MTQPQPQPMEITSKQMARIYNATDLKAVHSVMDEIRDIYTATHTPAAPATEPKPLRYSGVTVFTPPELSRHDAAIRKAGREQALDELTEFANSMSFLNVPILKGVLLHKIKSLRGGAP